MVYDNVRSPSWTHWMSQSTIHKRNVARQQQRTKLESSGLGNPQDLPVTIRVWRQLFTSRQVAVNGLGKFGVEDAAVNDYVADDYGIESDTIYQPGQRKERPWSLDDYFDDDDETLFTRSINNSTSAFGAMSPNTNLLQQSVLFSGLIATGCTLFAAPQIRRILLPTPKIPHFVVPFAMLVGTDGLQHQIAALPIQRMLHQNGYFEPKSIVSPLSWTNTKTFRTPLLLFVWCGYQVVSTASFGQQS